MNITNTPIYQYYRYTYQRMTEFLIRRNPVLEALRANRRKFYRLIVQDKLDREQIRPFLNLAKTHNIKIDTMNKQKLGQLVRDQSHQGIALEVGDYPYADIREMLTLAQSREERPFLLLLDLLHGPQNIGTLLRTAEICGVHGVIMQDRRAPDVTTAVSQYSAGAAEHLLIAQETNLVQAIRYLQQQDVWIIGMDLAEDAQSLETVDLDRPIGIVVGHEGDGMRRLVRESCDIRLTLPQKGRVQSLNASIAGSILLYNAWQARGFS
jgi:23S rRNA (guanosine2251-2'-O)-methyltransferase